MALLLMVVDVVAAATVKFIVTAAGRNIREGEGEGEREREREGRELRR